MATPLGDRLLELANGIISQQRANREFQFSVQQAENQIKQQKRNFQLQEEGLALQKENLELSRQKEARISESAAEQDRLTGLRADALQRELDAPTSAGSDLKASTIFKLRDEVFGEMEAAAVNRVVDSTIGSLQTAPPQGTRPETIAARFPRYSSVAQYNKFRREIAVLQKQIDAGASVMNFLRNQKIEVPLVGEVQFDDESEARAYITDMQAALDALRKNGFEEIERRAGTRDWPTDAVRARLGQKLGSFDPAQIAASVQRAELAEAARQQFFDTVPRTTLFRAIELAAPENGSVQPLLELTREILSPGGEDNMSAVRALLHLLVPRVGLQRGRAILTKLSEAL